MYENSLTTAEIIATIDAMEENDVTTLDDISLETGIVPETDDWPDAPLEWTD